MKLIDRYVITTVIKATLLILLVLVGILLFVELANEMRSVGKGRYHFLVAVQYVLMTLPRDIYMFFPMAGLIGGIVGLGVLAASHELVIMRATGVSVLQLCFKVLVAAFLLCIFITIIGEGVGPKLYKKASLMKEKAVYGNEALVTSQGLWMRMNNDFVRVEKVVDKTQLLDVTRYEFDSDHKLLALDKAASIDYTINQWVSHDVTRTILSSDKIQTTHLDKEVWGITLNPKVFTFSSEAPMAMSLVELHHFIQYRDSVGLSVNSYWLTFWQRIFQPLATLVMIFLAIPFVFGSLRSGTMGYRILMGIIVGLVFYLVSQLTGQVSLVYQLPAILSALLPILVFGLVGFVLILRVM
jgi:lipopolysaccharide export system permease protein